MSTYTSDERKEKNIKEKLIMEMQLDKSKVYICVRGKLCSWAEIKKATKAAWAVSAVT